MLGDIFSPVLSAVRQWRPSRSYLKEDGYRDDLVEHLSAALPGYVIKIEANRHLVDVGVSGRGVLGMGERVGIELKLDLQSKPTRNRLQGQIEDDLRQYPHVICVLCGHTDEAEYESLRVWAYPKLVSLQRLDIIRFET
jgi:hypothetical protein